MSTSTANYATNPSGETATTGYTAVAGTSGTAAITNPAPAVSTAFGTKVIKCAWSVASTAAGGGAYYELDIAAAGLAVADVISVGWFHLLSSIGNRIQLSVEFRTNVATISTTTATEKQVTAATIYSATDSPELKAEGLTIPATCTKIRVRVLTVAGTGYANWSIASYLELDGLRIVEAATLPAAYADGSSAPQYEWAGTADASTTTEYTPQMQLEAFPAEANPRVQITGTDVYPTTHHVTVYRIDAGIAVPVREGNDLFAVGGFSVTDYDAGFGVELTYRAMQHSEAGAELGYTPIEVVTLAVTRSVLSDPLRPQNAVDVDPSGAAGQRPQRPIPGAVHRIPAADGSLRVIALVGPQGRLTDLNMDFWTDTEVQRQAVETLLATAKGLVLLRTPAVGTMRMIPRSLYCWMPNAIPDEVNLSAGMEEVEWLNTVQELAPPEVGYGAPLVTWQTLIDAYPTWAALQAAHLTWLDIMQNPPEV